MKVWKFPVRVQEKGLCVKKKKKEGGLSLLQVSRDTENEGKHWNSVDRRDAALIDFD